MQYDWHQAHTLTLPCRYARLRTTQIPDTETVAKKIDLEKSLQELESIVETLEDGELSLEESLKHFEKGVKLSRECQTALKDAEQKVKILTEGELKDFDTDSNET
jgi:exodeoxyribonuclease VII small subunit